MDSFFPLTSKMFNAILSLAGVARGLLRKFFRSHPNYLIGGIVWLLAVTSLLLIRKTSPFKKSCPICAEYSRFVEALSPDQKAKLAMFDSGVIYVAGRFFYIGNETADEFDLVTNKLIAYKHLDPIITERKRRLIIVNSLLDSMPIKEAMSP